MLAMILRVADTVPEDDDVVAGGWGALMFVFLIAATVLLCFSLVKQLRKAQAAKEAGVYGDAPAKETNADEPRDQVSGG
jgi:hypothetical protein